MISLSKRPVKLGVLAKIKSAVGKMRPARTPVYVFRDPSFSPAGDTIVTAAPRKAVMAVYGGGGSFQTAGLAAAFGGCAVYRQGSLGRGEYHLAIWGERKASKFRQSLRNAGMEVEIIRSKPPGRLICYQTKP